MTQFFSIVYICFCLTMLSVTKDNVYITSSQQIVEHEKHVEVVGFKLLSQHLPGETQRNNEATSVSQSVIVVGHDSNQQPFRQESQNGLLQPNLLSYEPSAPRRTD